MSKIAKVTITTRAVPTSLESYPSMRRMPYDEIIARFKESDNPDISKWAYTDSSQKRPVPVLNITWDGSAQRHKVWHYSDLTKSESWDVLTRKVYDNGWLSLWVSDIGLKEVGGRE